MIPFYDAHNHLQNKWLAPHLDQVAADLHDTGIAGAVVNGTSPDDWSAVSALASRFSWVIPSYGVHPWDCGNRSDDWQGRLESRIATEPQAQIGEIGIDRWMLDRAKPDEPRLAGSLHQCMGRLVRCATVRPSPQPRFPASRLCWAIGNG